MLKCDTLRHGCSPVNLLDIFRKHFPKNTIPFSPLSDSCLTKIRVKIWDVEPYIWEPHAIPTKFRKKLISFHYRKIAIAQIYERETNLILREYILT